MEYPVEFIEKVKSVYSNDTQLIQALNEGNDAVVGRLLNLFAGVSISPEEIVNKLSEGNAQALLEKAKNVLLKQSLCKEFETIYYTKSGNIHQPAPGRN